MTSPDHDPFLSTHRLLSFKEDRSSRIAFDDDWSDFKSLEYQGILEPGPTDQDDDSSLLARSSFLLFGPGYDPFPPLPESEDDHSQFGFDVSLAWTEGYRHAESGRIWRDHPASCWDELDKRERFLVPTTLVCPTVHPVNARSIPVWRRVRSFDQHWAELVTRIWEIDHFWHFDTRVSDAKVVDTLRKKWNGELPPCVWRTCITCTNCQSSKRPCHHISTLRPTQDGIPLRCADCVLDNRDCVFELITTSPSTEVAPPTTSTSYSHLARKREEISIVARFLPSWRTLYCDSDHDNLDAKRFYLGMIWFDGMERVSLTQRDRPSDFDLCALPDCRELVVSLGGVEVNEFGYEVRRAGDGYQSNVGKRLREEDGEGEKEVEERVKDKKAKVALIASAWQGVPGKDETTEFRARLLTSLSASPAFAFDIPLPPSSDLHVDALADPGFAVLSDLCVLTVDPPMSVSPSTSDPHATSGPSTSTPAMLRMVLRGQHVTLDAILKAFPAGLSKTSAVSSLVFDPLTSSRRPLRLNQIGDIPDPAKTLKDVCISSPGVAGRGVVQHWNDLAETILSLRNIAALPSDSPMLLVAFQQLPLGIFSNLYASSDVFHLPYLDEVLVTATLATETSVLLPQLAGRSPSSAPDDPFVTTALWETGAYSKVMIRGLLVRLSMGYMNGRGTEFETFPEVVDGPGLEDITSDGRVEGGVTDGEDWMIWSSGGLWCGVLPRSDADEGIYVAWQIRLMAGRRPRITIFDSLDDEDASVERWNSSLKRRIVRNMRKWFARQGRSWDDTVWQSSPNQSNLFLTRSPTLTAPLSIIVVHLLLSDPDRFMHGLAPDDICGLLVAPSIDTAAFPETGPTIDDFSPPALRLRRFHAGLFKIDRISLQQLQRETRVILGMPSTIDGAG